MTMIVQKCGNIFNIFLMKLKMSSSISLPILLNMNKPLLITMKDCYVMVAAIPFPQSKKHSKSISIRHLKGVFFWQRKTDIQMNISLFLFLRILLCFFDDKIDFPKAKNKSPKQHNFSGNKDKMIMYIII